MSAASCLRIPILVTRTIVSAHLNIFKITDAYRGKCDQDLSHTEDPLLLLTSMCSNFSAVFIPMQDLSDFWSYTWLPALTYN